MEETLTLIEKTAFLKGIPVMSSIPTEALADLAARAREIHCDAGQVLFEEGDEDRGAFLVVDGTLEQRKGRALVRVVKSGGAVGELWLEAGETHHYTLVATDHTHVLNVTREDVVEAMHDFPEFGVAMVRGFAKTVHELTGRVLELENLVARIHASLRASGLDLPADLAGPSSDTTETNPP